MKLSIVSTLYKSAPYIIEFHKRASSVAVQLVGEDYEIVLVNDGSPDNSLELAVELAESDDHVVVVDLSRNFGHHKAMMTGLAQSRGELIFLIDSDLEEEPEYLIAFADQMKSQHCDVVYGVQGERKGGWFERWSGWLFYRLFNFLAGLTLPANLVTARLMTRRYVDALLLHKERELMLAGIWHITGFDQTAHKFTKYRTSETTYTFRHKMAVLVNGVTSFSNTPLLSIFYIGVLILVLSSIYIGYLILFWIFMPKPLSGWTSVMASIWFLGGMIIAFIGILGIYIAKIFSETKNRPYTIVRDIYSKQESRHLRDDKK